MYLTDGEPCDGVTEVRKEQVQAPALASAYLMAFTLSLDDLVIASFATGPGATTLPMRIYSQVRLGVTPEINAASTLLLAFVFCVLAVVALLRWRRAA